MAFTCPRCGRSSAHPDDEANGYCGACHAFTGGCVPSREWACPRCLTVFEVPGSMTTVLCGRHDPPQLMVIAGAAAQQSFDAAMEDLQQFARDTAAAFEALGGTVLSAVIETGTLVDAYGNRYHSVVLPPSRSRRLSRPGPEPGGDAMHWSPGAPEL